MAKTALRWLAMQVCPDSPCIIAFPPTPQDCLHWQGQVVIHPGCSNPKTQPKASVFCLGILTSTGSPSSRLRGTAAAVLQLEGVVWGATVICLGETVMKFNAQLAAFQLALALTNLFLWESNYTREVLILNDTKAVVPKAVDTRPGLDQPSSLDTTWHIEHILHKHANCSLRFTWGKRVDTQAAYKHAKTLVFNAVKDPFDPAHELSTINFQCTQAKAKAT